MDSTEGFKNIIELEHLPIADALKAYCLYLQGTEFRVHILECTCSSSLQTQPGRRLVEIYSDSL